MIHALKMTASAQAYGGDSADRIARFLPLVKRLAWHVHGGGCAGLEVEDLFQTGVVALTEAAQRHAGPGEDGFAAYAKLRVRGAMIDLIRRTVPASRHVVERRKLLQRHALALRGQLGREPSAAELAAAMRLSLGELGQLQSDCIEVRFGRNRLAHRQPAVSASHVRRDSWCRPRSGQIDQQHLALFLAVEAVGLGRSGIPGGGDRRAHV